MPLAVQAAPTPHKPTHRHMSIPRHLAPTVGQETVAEITFCTGPLFTVIDVAVSRRQLSSSPGGTRGLRGSTSPPPWARARIVLVCPSLRVRRRLHRRPPPCRLRPSTTAPAPSRPPRASVRPGASAHALRCYASLALSMPAPMRHRPPRPRSAVLAAGSTQRLTPSPVPPLFAPAPRARVPAPPPVGAHASVRRPLRICPPRRPGPGLPGRLASVSASACRAPRTAGRDRASTRLESARPKV